MCEAYVGTTSLKVWSNLSFCQHGDKPSAFTKQGIFSSAIYINISRKILHHGNIIVVVVVVVVVVIIIIIIII
jgi:hypothetical protein